MFNDLLIIDSIRGRHSTGALSVHGADNIINVFKKAVNGITFTDLKGFDKFMTKAITPNLLLGHNREASSGAVNDYNAHPFCSNNNTFLVHNGTLTPTSFSNLKGWLDTDVDSEAICTNIEEEGIVRTTPKLDGSFVLGYYSSNSKSFHLIRNEERPLWLAKVKDKDITIFASEPSMILVAADRNGVALDGEPVSLPSKVLISFDLSKTTNISEFEHNDDLKFHTKVDYYQNWGRHYTKKLLPPAKKSTTTTSMTTTAGTASKTPVLNSFLDDIGLSAGDEVVIQIGEFEHYNGKLTIRKATKGAVMSSWINPDDPAASLVMISYNMTKAFQTKHYEGIFYAEVKGASNRRANGIDHWTPIVEIKGELTLDEQADFWSLFSCATEGGEFRDESEKVFKDKEGRFVSESRFKYLTRDGCGTCNCSITPSDHDKIAWAYESPLCPSCTTRFAQKAKELGVDIEGAIAI